MVAREIRATPTTRPHTVRRMVIRTGDTTKEGRQPVDHELDGLLPDDDDDFLVKNEEHFDCVFLFCTFRFGILHLCLHVLLLNILLL